METNKTVGKGFLKCLPSTLNTQKYIHSESWLKTAVLKDFLVNAVNGIIIIRPEANVLLITPH